MKFSGFMTWFLQWSVYLLKDDTRSACRPQAVMPPGGVPGSI
jgi:hypothetical protein